MRKLVAFESSKTPWKSKLCSFCKLPAWWKTTQRLLVLTLENSTACMKILKIQKTMFCEKQFLKFDKNDIIILCYEQNMTDSIFWGTWTSCRLVSICGKRIKSSCYNMRYFKVVIPSTGYRKKKCFFRPLMMNFPFLIMIFGHIKHMQSTRVDHSGPESQNSRF